MNEKMKIAIVGGGIGGIFAGTLLARKGYEVKVYDKNPIVGGYCQSFRRKGVQIHPAVLRVGSKSCADMITDYCEQAGIKDLEWNSYKEFYQFGDTIKINQCIPDIEQEIIKFFPEDKECVERFFKDIRDLYEIMNKVFANNMTLRGLTASDVEKYIPTISMTAIQFVDQYFAHNKVLKDIILAMLELDDKSVALAIPMTYFEIKGQGLYYVPKGGAYSIIQKCIKIIESNGGRVHNNATVEKIKVKDGLVTGICVNGEEVSCDIAISGIDINKTYRELIGEEFIENKKMLQMLESKWRISKSCFSIWLGFDKPLEELGIEEGSIIYYPNQNQIQESRIVMQTEGECLPDNFWYQIFTAFSSDEQSTPRENSQMCIGILLPYHFQNEWGGTENYKQTKEDLVNRVLDDVEKRYPGIREHCLYVESATPLTYERECGNTRGAYLGFEKYQNFVYDRKKHTNQGLFPNLFFSSHWVSIIGGVNGVMQEGIKTANLILQKHPIKCDKCEKYDLFR